MKAFKVFLLSLLLLQTLSAALQKSAPAVVFFNGQPLSWRSPLAVDGDGFLYAPVRELAAGLGLELSHEARQDTYTVSRPADRRAVLFQTNARKVRINGQTADELSDPAVLFDGAVYVPLNDFLWLFGYFVEKAENGSYYIVTRLNAVNWTPRQLVLQGEAPLAAEISRVADGYQLFLRNTILVGEPLRKISPADGVIETIECRQETLRPGAVKILLHTAKWPAYTLVTKDAEGSYTLSFDYQATRSAGTAAPARPAEQVLSAVSGNVFPGLNALWLPEKYLSARGSIEMLVRSLTLNVSLKSTADILYVDFDSVFGQLGCTLRRENERYIFTDNKNRTFRVENGLIYGPGFQEKYPLLRQGRAVYFPLVQTLKCIGYAAYYTQERVYINPRIYELSYADTGGQRRVIVRANDRLLGNNIRYLADPPRVLIDVPFCAYDVPLNILRINDRNVKTVRAAQFDKGVVRIVADLQDGQNKPVLTFEDNGQALVLLFDAGKLARVDAAPEPAGGLRLRFQADSGNQLSNYTVKKLDNPDRLILDFPGAVSSLNNELALRQGAVERLRASQFSWEPLQARVVLDLNSAYGHYEQAPDGSLLVYRKTAAPVSAAVTVVPTPAAKAVSPLKGARVAIIVGHGGMDPGAISRQGYMEKDLTLDLAKKLQTVLREKGAVALLSREGDEHLSLDGQAEFAIRNKAELLVSIHLNYFVNESANGAESFYYKPIDYALAKSVHEEIVRQTQLRDRGLQKAQMHNLNHTTMPGVLIEPLFISNRKEEKLIKSADFQWKLARAVAAGLENYQRTKK